MFSHIGYKVIIKVRHSCVIKEWHSNCNIFKLHVSPGSATRFLRNGDKYYICVINNLLLFPAEKEFSKSLSSWWSYCKRFDTTFFSETPLRGWQTSWGVNSPDFSAGQGKHRFTQVRWQIHKLWKRSLVVLYQM